MEVLSISMCQLFPHGRHMCGSIIAQKWLLYKQELQ